MTQFSTKSVIGHPNGSSRRYGVMDEPSAGAALARTIDHLVDDGEELNEGLLVVIAPYPQKHHEQAPA